MESKYVYVESPNGLVEVKAFLDPAVPKSFINECFFKKLGFPKNLIQTITINVQGKPFEEHCIWIQVYVDGNRFREKCRILEGLSEDLVLGTPALARCGLIPDPENEQQPRMQMRLKIRPIGENQGNP